ncbi:MAG: hypothetical protein AAF700_05095 [Pseudomonadota bacterium]
MSLTSGDADHEAAGAMRAFQIDGTGEPGDVICLTFEDGLQFEVSVGEDGTWEFAINRELLSAMPRLAKAALQVTCSTGPVSETEIWIDLKTNSIFDYRPNDPVSSIADGFMSLSDALAAQMPDTDDPLLPYGVRAIDLNLANFDTLSIDANQIAQLEGLEVLVIHGTQDHLVGAADLIATGKQEEIGDRTYTVFTCGSVDIVIDGEIKVVS